MVYPVAKYWTLHLILLSREGDALVCIPQGMHTHENAQGSSEDLPELLSADTWSEIL